MISATGIGSGLDVDSIVSQLMAIEEQPIYTLQQEAAYVEAEISALGQLKSALAGLQSTAQALESESAFFSASASSSDDDVITATAENSAVSGSYDLVVSTLAENHKLASASFTSTEEIGTGVITIATGSGSFDVAISSTANTISDIRNAINNDANNTGVTASVITVDGGDKLILTSDKGGTENVLQITVSDDGDGDDTDNTDGLSRLVYETSGTQNLTQVQAGVDASFTIDTYTVTKSSNTITDVIEGVTINLVATGNATVEVSEDKGVALSSMQKLASSYNGVVDSISALRTSGMAGDSLLRNIEVALRDVFRAETSGLAGTLTTSYEAGFSFDKYGQLSIDTTTFNAALADDFDGLKSYFTDTYQGFGDRMDKLIDSYAGVDGSIDGRTTSLNTQADGILDQISTMQVRLTNIEARYRAQFSALDALVASLNVTSDYLTQQLDNLPGVVSKSK